MFYSISQGIELEPNEESPLANTQGIEDFAGGPELSDPMLSYTATDEIREQIAEFTYEATETPVLHQNLQIPRQKEFDEDSTYESSSDRSEFEDDEDDPQQEMLEEVTKFPTEVRSKTTESQDLSYVELGDHNTDGLTSKQFGCFLEFADPDGRQVEDHSSFIDHIKQGSTFDEDMLAYAASLPLPADVVVDEKDSDWDEESNCDDCRFNDIQEMEQFLATAEAEATEFKSVEDVERVYVEFGISQNAIIEQSFCQEDTESGEAHKQQLKDKRKKEMDSEELTESVTQSLARSLSLQDVEPPNDCNELVSLFQTSMACTEPGDVKKADVALEPPVVNLQEQCQPHVREQFLLQQPSLLQEQSLSVTQEQVHAGQILDADSANLNAISSLPATDVCQPLMQCRGQHNLLQEQCHIQEPSLPQSLPVILEQVDAKLDVDDANVDGMSSMPAADVCQPLMQCRGQHNLLQEQCQLQDPSIPQDQSLPALQEQLNGDRILDYDVANVDGMSSVPNPNVCQPLVPCRGQHNLMQEQSHFEIPELSLPQERSLPAIQGELSAGQILDADVNDVDGISSVPDADVCQPLMPCRGQHNLIQEQCQFEMPQPSLSQEQSLPAMQKHVNANQILDSDVANLNAISSMPATDVCQPLVQSHGQYNLLQAQCPLQEPSLPQEQSLPDMQEQLNASQLLDADTPSVDGMSSVSAPDACQALQQEQCQFKAQEPSPPQDLSLPVMQEQDNTGPNLDADRTNVNAMFSIPDVCQSIEQEQEQCQFQVHESSQDQSPPVTQEPRNARQVMDAKKIIAKDRSQSTKSRKKRFIPRRCSEDSDSDGESYSSANVKRPQMSKYQCGSGKGKASQCKRGLKAPQEGMQRKRTRSKMSLSKNSELNIQQESLVASPPQQTSSDCRNIDENFANLVTKSLWSYNNDTVEKQQSQGPAGNLFTAADQGISAQGPPAAVPVAEMPSAEELVAQSSMADDQGYDSVDDELAELFSKSFKSLNVENDDGFSQGDNKCKRQRVSLQIPQLPVINQQLIKPSSLSFAQPCQPSQQQHVPILQLAEMPEPIAMEQQNQAPMSACFNAQNVPTIIQPKWPNFTGVFTNQFAPRFDGVTSHAEGVAMFSDQAAAQDEAMPVVQTGAETEVNVGNDCVMATEPTASAFNQDCFSKESVIFTTNCDMAECDSESLNASELLAALSDSLEPTTVNATSRGGILTMLDANSEDITEETNYFDDCIVVGKWEREWPIQETEMKPALDDASTTVIHATPCLNALKTSPCNVLSDQDSVGNAPKMPCMSGEEEDPKTPTESSASNESCGIISTSVKFSAKQEDIAQSTLIASTSHLLDCSGDEHKTKVPIQKSLSCPVLGQMKLSSASNKSNGTDNLAAQSTHKEEIVKDSTVMLSTSHLLDYSGAEHEAKETVNSCAEVCHEQPNLVSDEPYGTVNLSTQSTQKEDAIKDSTMIPSHILHCCGDRHEVSEPMNSSAGTGLKKPCLTFNESCGTVNQSTQSTQTEDFVNDSTVITHTCHHLDCSRGEKGAKELRQNSDSYAAVRLTKLRKQRKRKLTEEDVEDDEYVIARKKQKLAFTLIKSSVVEIGKSSEEKREAILSEEDEFKELHAAKRQRLDIFALIKLGRFSIGESRPRKRKAADEDEEDFEQTPKKKCRVEAYMTKRAERKAGARKYRKSPAATRRRFKLKRSSVAHATA